MKDKNLQARLEIVIEQLVEDSHFVKAEQVRQAIAEIERLESVINGMGKESELK